MNKGRQPEKSYLHKTSGLGLRFTKKREIKREGLDDIDVGVGGRPMWILLSTVIPVSRPNPCDWGKARGKANLVGYGVKRMDSDRHRI